MNRLSQLCVALTLAALLGVTGCSPSKDEPKSSPEQQQQVKDAMGKYDKKK